MKFFSRTAKGAAIVISTVLLAGSAGAATHNFSDDVFDAWGFTDYSSQFGDFDIDLTRVDVDHGTRDLNLTARFTRLVPDSWTHFRALLDTNQDGFTDYTILWGREQGTAFVMDEDELYVCDVKNTTERLGAGGSLAVTVSRSCIGNPATVAVHVDAMWMGYNEDWDDLYFVDSAPGEFVEDWTTFSAPVRSSNTGSATSPQAPKPVAKKTSVSAKLSSKTFVLGSKAPKLTVKPKGSGNPKGRVKITVKGKTVKNVSTRAGKKVTYTFKKNLKPGKHKVKVTFTPSDRKRWKTSSKTVTLTVKR